ncbi:RecB-like helicase [Campylobacter sp.]|uniref:RecB-like helicase n=1 Tax=Campylobacter sp. TaxID=205 RepID=UPI0026F9AD73|nr:RecB-like helicase [Campylobacter sp.]
MKPFLALEASAGSGKTFALSVRFIAIILNGVNPNEIVALTFTKKAANEMKERIIKTFLNLETHSAELDEISKMLDKTEDEILAMRDKQKAKFLESNLKISTFDSFFASILRQFSLNLGLSPDFLISSNLKELQRGEFVAKISQNEQLLRSFAASIVAAQKSQNSFFETLEMFYENFSSLKTKPNAKFPTPERVYKALENLRRYAESKEGSQTAINSFSQAEPLEILKRSFIARDSLEYRTYNKIYTPYLDELFFELKSELKSYFKQLEEYKLSELELFLQIYKNVKFELNKKLNALTFSDINALVYELLCGGLDNEMLYFRLDGRINHLLIDEFQDTNVRQYEIMKPLIAEIVSGYGQNGLGSFFYVGDIKQSIYRFRGGKKELFEKLKVEFSQIEDESLDTNYRSFKALVKFSNAVFKDKISNFIEQKACVKDDDRVRDLEVLGECEYFKAKSDDYGFLRVVSSDDIVNEAVAQTKNLLLNGVAQEDITILCWKNDDIDRLVAALESEGIKSVAESATTLIKSPYVGAVIEYAKFCLFADEIYRLNTQAILDVKANRLRVDMSKPAFQSLKYLADKLGVSSSNTDMLRLYEVAAEYKNLANFIFNLEKIEAKASPKSKSGVKIMTVHKSKGLQFEHVIVCDKIGGDKNDSSNFIAEYDMSDGWQIKHNVKKEGLDEEFARLKERAKELEYAEDINKLYVAFTRAICSLVVVKKSIADGKNPSFFSSYVSNGEDIEYLNLKEFSFGKILPSKSEKLPEKMLGEYIDIVKISRQEVDENLKESGKNLHAIYFGLALHYLLEMTVKFDENELSMARISMQNRFYKFLSQSELEDVFLSALNLIKDPKFQEFTTDKRVFKEQPFRFKNSLKQIDLLCLGDDEICVIDYKSSKKNTDENIAQITQYKEAIKRFYPNLNVRAALFYAFKDKTEYIEI